MVPVAPVFGVPRRIIMPFLRGRKCVWEKQWIKQMIWLVEKCIPVPKCEEHRTIICNRTIHRNGRRFGLVPEDFPLHTIIPRREEKKKKHDTIIYIVFVFPPLCISYKTAAAFYTRSRVAKTAHGVVGCS